MSIIKIDYLVSVAIAEFSAMLLESGYVACELQCVPLPNYLRHDMQQAGETSITGSQPLTLASEEEMRAELKDVIEGVTYYRVATDCGEFGFILHVDGVAKKALDLTGTGIKGSDVSEDTFSIDMEYDYVVGLDHDPLVLTNLRSQLLAKRAGGRK